MQLQQVTGTAPAIYMASDFFDIFATLLDVYKYH